jgi:hypothetical protein
MNNDNFDYHIHIEHFSGLLLWLTVVCLLGAAITSLSMMTMSKFFLTDKNAATGRVQKFSIIDFELPYSFSRFKNLIDHISEKTKDTVRMNLRMDYCFMPFIYLFLFFGGWYIMQRHHLFALNPNNYKILFLPFIAWLLDIVENRLAFACLANLTRTASWSLFFVSFAKWLSIFAYLVLLFVMDWHH